MLQEEGDAEEHKFSEASSSGDQLSLQDDEYEIDEMMMFEQVKCSDSDEVLMNFLESEEFRASLHDQSIDYQALYEVMKKKALMALKLLKKHAYFDGNSAENSEKAKLEREYQKQTADLRQQLVQISNEYKHLTDQVKHLRRENDKHVKQIRDAEKVKSVKCDHCSAFASLDSKSLPELEKLTIALNERLFAVSARKSDMIEEQAQAIKKLQKQISDGPLCVVC